MSITYTHEIKNICDEVVCTFECGERGLTIEKDDRRVSLEHDEIDALLDVIKKYSLMVQVGKANAEAILKPEETSMIFQGERRDIASRTREKIWSEWARAEYAKQTGEL